MNIRDMGSYGQKKAPTIRLYFAVFVCTLSGSMSYVLYTNIIRSPTTGRGGPRGSG